MPRSAWGNQKTIKFVQLYKSKTCLWNREDFHYSNKYKRTEAFKELVQEMNMENFNISECKYKIKNIRSHYLQELRKISEAAAKGNTYVPVLAWFKLVDSFLGKHSARKKNIIKYSYDSAYQNTAEPGDEFEVVDTDSVTANPIFKINGSQTDDESNIQNPVKRSANRMNTLVGKKNCIDCPENAEYDKTAPAEHTVVERSIIPTDPLQKTEFEAFARSIIAQFTNMPFHEALKLQLKIQVLITEERLKYLDGSSHCTAQNMKYDNTASGNYYDPNMIKEESGMGGYDSNMGALPDPLQDDSN